AIGYMVLAITNMHPDTPTWFFSDGIPALLFVLSVLLCMLFFRDVRDKKVHEAYRKRKGDYVGLARSEFIALWKDIGRTSTRWGLLAYLLWATSQYSVLILITDFDSQYISTIVWMMCGYLAGVAFLGFCQNIRDETIMRLGFGLTIASLLMFFIANPFVETIQLSFTVCYFLYTMGNAFLSATILTLFSKERHAHDQGKGFGLIVSADSGGFLLATIAGIVHTNFHLKLIHMVIFSSVLFAVSWIPYIKYERARREISGKKPLIF
ncbi:MAG TPA: MFS transporter, partial [Rhabdochlamydiaceae bacterium]